VFILRSWTDGGPVYPHDARRGGACHRPVLARRRNEVRSLAALPRPPTRRNRLVATRQCGAPNGGGDASVVRAHAARSVRGHVIDSFAASRPGFPIGEFASDPRQGVRATVPWIRLLCSVSARWSATPRRRLPFPLWPISLLHSPRVDRLATWGGWSVPADASRRSGRHRTPASHVLA